MASNNKHWTSDLFKNKFVKIPFIIAVWALMIFFVFVLFKAMLGYHINIFGMELNIPEPKAKSDTTLGRIAEFRSDSSSLKNINTTVVESKPLVIPDKIYNKKTSPDTTPKIQSTVNGDNAHIVNGVNHGVNGDVIINKERELTDDDKKYILNSIAVITDTMTLKPSCFSIGVLENSNPGKLVSQVGVFMRSLGYSPSGKGTLSGMSFTGLKVRTRGGNTFRPMCIEIMIGDLQ